MHDGQNLFDESFAIFGEWGIDETLEEIYKNQKESVIVVGIETSGYFYTVIYILLASLR